MSLNSSPLVSIVTPAYNAADYILETMESAKAQSYQNWEMIVVVDSKSKDSTFDIVLKASTQDPRIRLIQDSGNSGASENRNIAINNSRGEFIAFLDSDDRWLPNKLEVQLQAMVEENLNISYHSFDIIDEEGKTYGPTRYAKYDVGYRDLLKNNCMGCLTVMVRKSFIREKRMKNVRHEDLHFWLQLMENGESAYPIATILAEYRVRRNSVSDNKFASAVWRWELYQELNIPTFLAIYYMALYTMFAINKRIKLLSI